MRGADPPVGVGGQMKLSPHDSSLDALKFVVDMADVPMVITDEDGRFVFANGHTLDIVGKADGRMIRRILGIGLPNGMENSMFQLGKIMVLSLVSTFGTSAIAANAVSNAVAQFQILPGMAINLAVTAVIARCIGAGRYDQAEYYTKKLVLLVYFCHITVNICIWLALPLILKVYNLSPETADTARQILHFHGICASIVWPVAFTLPCTLRAAGDAKVTMYISIASMWFCRIVMSYVLGKYLGMGVFGVWVAMIFDWCVRFVAMTFRYRQGKWKQIDSLA